MPRREDNLSPPPFTEHKDHHPSYNRLLAFRRGFKRGVCWSLLLAVPVAAKMFVDTYNGWSIRYSEETETTFRITLSWLETVLCMVTGLAVATVFVTLPWALVTAIVAVWRRPKFSENAH